MYLISTGYQNSRSKANPDKPGRVFMRISEQHRTLDGRILKTERTVNTNLLVADKDALSANAQSLVPLIHRAYKIIEKRHLGNEYFTIDDVVADLRSFISQNDYIVAAGEGNYLLRGDLVRVGNIYKNFFTFVYPHKNHAPADNLLDFISSEALSFREKGRESSFRAYKSLQHSLCRFAEKNFIPFSGVNQDFVRKYNLWLERSNLALSTQSFFLRNLRSVLNKASKKYFLDFSDDLFAGTSRKLSFTSEESVKFEVFTRDHIRLLSKMELSDPFLDLVRNMFLFAFYCHGMELNEVVNLRKCDISNLKLIYRRRGNGKPREIKLNKAALEIIDIYKTKTRLHIFPLIENSSVSNQYTISEKVRVGLKQIGKQIGFEKLSFTYNISAWKDFIENIDPIDLISK